MPLNAFQVGCGAYTLLILTFGRPEAGESLSTRLSILYDSSFHTSQGLSLKTTKGVFQNPAKSIKELR